MPTADATNWAGPKKSKSTNDNRPIDGSEQAPTSRRPSKLLPQCDRVSAQIGSNRLKPWRNLRHRSRIQKSKPARRVSTFKREITVACAVAPTGHRHKHHGTSSRRETRSSSSSRFKRSRTSSPSPLGRGAAQGEEELARTTRSQRNPRIDIVQSPGRSRYIIQVRT